MYSQEEIETALDHHDWNISDALYKIERFAQSQGLTDLDTWANQELNGYPSGFRVFEERPYRVVEAIWQDVYGQILIVPPELILTLGRQPLSFGVQSLEGFSQEGLLLQNPDHMKLLNQWSTVELRGAIVHGGQIRSLLERIRMEARRRFHNALPRIPNRFLAYQAPNFAILVPDIELANILGRRWAEANSCFAAEAHLATVIMLGSVLEGVLLSYVQHDPVKANSATASPKDKTTGKPLFFRDWTLQNLIDVSHECGWLKKQDKDFSHIIREYRNFVHPNKELQEGVTFGANTCRVIFEVVTAALS